MKMEPDFNIKISVRNARLLRAIRKKYKTSAALAKDAGVSQSQIAALITMKARPFKPNGALTSAAEGIVSALGVTADELWPEHIARLKAKRAQVEIEMSAHDFAEIANSDPEKTAIYRQAISKWSQTLNPREREAIVLYYSGGTLEDVGKELRVNRERARQIICKGERKMRGGAIKDGFRCFEDFA
jgi:RNA polymerase sigma factor (sigma-70 family)